MPAAADFSFGKDYKGHSWPHGMSEWDIHMSGARQTVARGGLSAAQIERFVAQAVAELDVLAVSQRAEATIREASDEAVEACMAMVGKQLEKYDRIRGALTEWVRRYDGIVSALITKHAPLCSCMACLNQRVLRDEMDAFWKNNPQ